MRLVALTFAMVVLATACGVAKGPYVRENELIIDSLPLMQGAMVVKMDSSPYCLTESCYGSDGYSTNVVYEPPDNFTAQSVIDFYAVALSDEWQYRQEEIPVVNFFTGKQTDTVLIALFIKGKALVAIMTDNMMEGGPHTFELGVDHRGNR